MTDPRPQVHGPSAARRPRRPRRRPQPQRGPRGRRPPVRRPRLEHPRRPAAETRRRAAQEGPAVPILRIFDRAKAVEFYVDYLGFVLDWEHGGHADHSPLYAQVSRGAARLHLSEHHGDASPGGAALIPVTDVEALHAELAAHDYDYARPGISDEDWGRVLVVVDPFHNRLVFHQPVAAGRRARARRGRGADRAHLRALLPARGRVRRRSPAGSDEWWHPAYAPEGLERVVQVEEPVGGSAYDAPGRRTDVPRGGPSRSGTRRAATRRPSPSPRIPSTRARSTSIESDGAGGTAAARCASRTAAGRPATSPAAPGSPSGRSCSTASRRWRRDGRCPRARARAAAAAASVQRMTDVTVSDNRDESRFEAHVDGGWRASPPTSCPTASSRSPIPRWTTRSRGRASARRWSARRSTRCARTAGCGCGPWCPFVRAWIDQHPDYADLTRRPMSLSDDLRRYLQEGRDAVVRSLDGLSEYDVRRPLVPSGTNLLGLVKHLTGIELGYLGTSVGRTPPVRAALGGGRLGLGVRGPVGDRRPEPGVPARPLPDGLAAQRRVARDAPPRRARVGAVVARGTSRDHVRPPRGPGRGRDRAARGSLRPRARARRRALGRADLDARDDAWWTAYVQRIQDAADRYR